MEETDDYLIQYTSIVSRHIPGPENEFEREKVLISMASQLEKFTQMLKNSLWFIDMHMKQESVHSGTFKPVIDDQYDENSYILYNIAKTDIMWDSKNRSLKFLYRNQLNRFDDFPAEITVSGVSKYYYKGKLHRPSGPAIINEKTGVIQFYWEGKRHNVSGGPVVKGPKGQYIYARFGIIGKGPRAKQNAEPSINWGGIIVYVNDMGILHRGDSGPAYINTNTGEIRYYYNGQLHRAGNLPAVIRFDRIEFYEFGQRHREEGLGPAIEYKDGSYAYYSHGRLHSTTKNKATVHKFGIGSAYYRHGRLSNPPGIEPAVILDDGTIEFWVDGTRHREYGPDSQRKPAIIRPDGTFEIWDCGIRVNGVNGVSSDKSMFDVKKIEEFEGPEDIDFEDVFNNL